jgi:hypothetical protein
LVLVWGTVIRKLLIIIPPLGVVTPWLRIILPWVIPVVKLLRHLWRVGIIPRCTRHLVLPALLHQVLICIMVDGWLLCRNRESLLWIEGILAVGILVKLLLLAVLLILDLWFNRTMKYGIGSTVWLRCRRLLPVLTHLRGVLDAPILKICS